MSTLTILLIIAALVIVQLIGLVVVVRRFNGKNAQPEQDQGGMLLLQKEIQNLRTTVDTKLGEGNKQVSDSLRDQFAKSQQLVKNIEERVSTQLLEVVKGVSETKESTKQVFNIAEQLKNLERVLTNQKQRGNLGERGLELILSNVLPGQYETQYEFKNGEKVDFMVKTSDGGLPVDAKFPLENFERFFNETDAQLRLNYQREFKKDLKDKIDETSKYIREEEGSLPFAFMYIPAEGIFSALSNSEEDLGINASELISYAEKKKVYITSPATFLVFLQTVLLNNKRQKFLEGIKGIEKNVAELAKHLKAYEGHHNSLGKSLSAAVGHYENSSKAFKAVDKDVVKISGEPINLEIEPVDRPLLPEA